MTSEELCFLLYSCPAVALKKQTKKTLQYHNEGGQAINSEINHRVFILKCDKVRFELHA